MPLAIENIAVASDILSHLLDSFGLSSASRANRGTTILEVQGEEERLEAALG